MKSAKGRVIKEDAEKANVASPYTGTKVYAARMSRGSSSYRRYLLPAPDLSSKPVGRRCCYPSMAPIGDGGCAQGP